jgi:hypothetical protein
LVQVALLLQQPLVVTEAHLFMEWFLLAVGQAVLHLRVEAQVGQQMLQAIFQQFLTQAHPRLLPVVLDMLVAQALHHQAALALLAVQEFLARVEQVPTVQQVAVLAVLAVLELLAVVALVCLPILLHPVVQILAVLAVLVIFMLVVLVKQEIIQ